MWTTVPANGSAPLAAPAGSPPAAGDRHGTGARQRDGAGPAGGRRHTGVRPGPPRGPRGAGRSGNLLRLHTDLPNHWDAWDIDQHYRNRFTELPAAGSVTVVARDPLAGAVRVERAFGNGSRITQTITLRAGSPRIDFETEIDWHEAEKILKAGFPLDIRAPHSSAEIQFGHVQRPTHTNTSWEAARFEVFGHRWVHLGEPGYGVAVLSDSTYGHDVTRTVRDDGGTTTTVRLSLVRAPRIPDPGPTRARTASPTRCCPARASRTPSRRATRSTCRCAWPGRRAPGPGGLGGRRGHDRRGGQARRRRLRRCRRPPLRIPRRTRHRHPAHRLPLGGAQVTDLLERPLEPADTDGDSVPVALRPFQVLTLRLAVDRNRNRD
ncbi:glycoside hydrolase family 38 C-terminal domain-containing protein [Streptomyces sp. INA 01156]